LKTGEECYLRGDEVFPTASVVKIFFLAELFRQAETGMADLSQRIEIPAGEAAIGSGVLNKLYDSVSLTLRDHAALMMRFSDNTATDAVVAAIGEENVRKNVLERLSLHNTKIGDRFVTPEDGNRRMGYYNMVPTDTSPRDAVTFFRALHSGTLLSQEGSRAALDMMQPNLKADRLQKELPKEVAMRRKSGSVRGVFNDAGIVFTDKGDYVITAFYNAKILPDPAARDAAQHGVPDLYGRLGRAVYDIYMSE
jgi:beta-lactamase class A